MTNSQIDRRIRELTGEHPESRPFVCAGSPFGCAVAQIGINPGTPTPFWPHWSVEKGFDKPSWLKDYLQRHGKLGPTRRNIDVFSEALRPNRCIELNLYDRFSPRLSGLAKELRRTDVLDFVLECVRPRLILVHGDDPAAYLAELFGTRLVKDAFTPVRYRSLQVEVLQAKSHFMKVSRDYVRELASRFSARLQTAA
jgi:hypothetical protein